MKMNNIIGATTEHWMDKRLRLNKPINLTGNLIKVSAEDLLKLHQYKNELLGISKSLADASIESDDEREGYLY